MAWLRKNTGKSVTVAETEAYVLKLNTFVCVCVDLPLLFQSLFVFNSSKSLLCLLIYLLFLNVTFLAVVKESPFEFHSHF